MAFARFRSRVLSQNFVPYKFHPRRAQFEPKSDDNLPVVTEIIIDQDLNTRPEHCFLGVSSEAYVINATQEGEITIQVSHPVGALRALDTLSQLFFAHSSCDEAKIYTPYAPFLIKDAPAFEHRGLNLDINRNWIPPSDVLRTIQAIAINKLNRLHLHATDAQSWPIEVPSLPNLAREGAYMEDQIWTVKDLEKVQRHGLYHGVEVFLEVNLPGHTASIHHSYPHLITACNQPWATYACEPPAGQLKLNSPDVPPFLTKLLNDLLPRSVPFSSHFHIGGDELDLEAYKLDDTVRSSSKEVIRPLLQRLMNHVISLVQSHGLTPVVWADMLLEWDFDLSPNVIVHTWRSASSLGDVVAKSHRALFGPCEEWYLDCGYGTFIDPDPINTDSPIKRPFHDWCSPYKNWRQILSFDPLKDIPEEKRRLVVGGEVHLWGELTDSANLVLSLNHLAHSIRSAS